MRTHTNERDVPGLGRARAVAAAGVVGTMALLATAAPVFASERSSQDLTGVTISCGDHLLTFTRGVQVGDLHRVVLGNGREVVILSVVFHDTTLSDEAGNSYRAVGGANSTARVTIEGDPASLAGHFNVSINVLGVGGRVGKVTLRERTASDGTVDLVTGGGCSL
ncbi:MAG: hypothetical protein ABIW49_12700 [Knoellia sp.]